MLRRAVPVLLGAMLAAMPAAAQQGGVTRVTGTVTAQNYPALAAFLQDRLDQVVALSVDFPANDVYAPGTLSAYKDGDLFLAYVAGPGGSSQISAATGYLEEPGRFVFDRHYKVTYGGMGQGIVAVVLEPTQPPGGAVSVVAIDDLPEPAE
jgi:hypothetical protein